MFRVGVIGFIYVMLLLTYMFRVGVIVMVYICNVTVDIYV